MLEIIIDNRDGVMWDISGIVSNVSYKSSRIGKASSTDLTFVRNGIYQEEAFTYNVGDVVRIRQDGVNLFYGYIFTIDSGRGEEVKITAYDQLRYLAAKDSRVFVGVKAGEIIQRLASDFGLKVGTLEDTGYVLPPKTEDDVTLLDMICNALTQTLIATNRNYVFYDDFGELVLKSIENMMLDISIGDVSLMYDYRQKRSIDDSYNRVKIVQDNKEAGNRKVFIAQDSANIAKWGLLQYFQVADEKMNEAQINEALNNLIKAKNRESRKFRIEAIGDARVRAGSFVSVNVAELGIDQYYMVDECTHKFDGVDHTMTLDLVDIRIGDAAF
jgi:hypothetical protein